MNIYKYAIMSLAIGSMLTACSDDDNYTPGAASPGAYFPSDAPAIVELAEGSNTVNVPIYRTEAVGTATYNIQVKDETGLFSGPSSVTFEGNSLVANIVFSYDPENIVAEEVYPCAISVDQNSTTIYGQSAYSFGFKLMAATTREYVGTGLYTYTAVFQGYDPGLDCFKISTEGNEETYEFEIEHWLGDVTLKINVDYSILLTNGGHPAYVLEQSTGYVDADLGLITVMDYDSYLTMVGRPQNSGYYGWYIEEKGLFNIAMMYLARNYNGTNGIGADYETFQMEGFPNYEISVAFDGVVNDAENYQSYALATVTTGEDVENVRVAVFSGEADGSMLDMLDAGSVEYVTVAGEGTTQSAKLPIPGAGTYTLIATSYGEGERQEYSYVEFTINQNVVEQGTWEDVGTGVFVDGFITPFFGYRNSSDKFIYCNPFDYAYDVKIQKEVSGKMPNMYRMLYPYGPTSGNIIAEELNTTPDNARCISFDMTNPDIITFPFQNTGFTYSGVNFYLCDAGWYYLEEGYNDRYLTKNKLNSYFDEKENCVYVQAPRMCRSSNSHEIEEANDYHYPAIIYMPDGYAQAKAALAAIKMVTSPNLSYEALVGEASAGEKEKIKMLNPDRTFKEPVLIIKK